MKKSELAILSVLILAAVFVFNGKINKVTNPCVQDYAALREHYPEGISLIRKEFHLLWLSKLNYPSYQTYGWQATTGSEEARQQAQFVSRFFDIYENSFK